MVIGPAFDKVFTEAPGRVIVATFASLISRIQQVAEAAEKHKRKMALAGTSMVAAPGITSTTSGVSPHGSPSTCTAAGSRAPAEILGATMLASVCGATAAIVAAKLLSRATPEAAPAEGEPC